MSITKKLRINNSIIVYNYSNKLNKKLRNFKN